MAETKQNWIRWLVLAVLCLSAQAATFAQSAPSDSLPSNFIQIQSPQSGSLSGRLTNLHSAPLAGVCIVLRNQTTGAEARTTTAKNGVFRFASLDAGEYTLDADAAQLGHGRLEGILVTGGVESRVQAAIHFEPVSPAILEATTPPQTAGSPIAAASMPPETKLSAVSEPPSPPHSPEPGPVSIALSAPAAFPRPAPGLASRPTPWPAPSTTSPQLVASIANEPMSRLPLRISPGADAIRPSAEPSVPTQVAPPVALPPSAPTKSPIIALPTATPAPSATQHAQPQAHILALLNRTTLETQSAADELALAAVPPRTFPLKSSSAPVLAATAVPPSLVQDALLNPPPLAATVAATQLPDPVTPAVASTVFATQLQALPASGRRWQEFMLDTPAAGASADTSQTSFRGSQQAAQVTIDGANAGLAFGIALGSDSHVSGSSSESSDRQRSATQSQGQSWTGGRGLGVSEAAIREVTTAAGNVETEGMRPAGGRTSIRTESGANALHGQGFYFDRQNTWGARNPFTQWVTETAPDVLAYNPSGPPLSVPVFDNGPYGSPESYTPPDHEMVWGIGAGSRIRRDKLFWFAALDSYHRNDPGLAMVKHSYLQPPCEIPPCPATGFFAQPSDAQLQLLSAQLGLPSASPVNEALAPYSSTLETLASLLGPAPRTAAQWVGFGRIDWQAAERHHFTVESISADWNSPGGGLTGVAANYGNHSFGSSQASQQWLLARWEAYLTPNLLAVTQGSAGRAVLSAKPEVPSAFESTFLLGNAYGQLPQIAVDSSYGFTIGNPSRFGQGSYPDERLYHGQEMLDWVHNRLLVKAGFELDHNADAVRLLRNQTGSYTYSKVENFISDALVFEKFGFADALDPTNPHNCDPTGKPWYTSNGQLMGLGALPCYSHFSQMIGPTNWRLSTNDWAGYVTAQWQAGKIAVFSAGLRWEREQMPPPLAVLANPDLPQAGKMPDLGNDWGPRISVAFGEAKTRWPVLRVGYGMYYGVTQNATIETALTQTGSLNGDLSYFVRPTDGFTSVTGISAAPPFPYVLTGPPSSVVKPGATVFASNFRNPEIHEAVAAVEQPLPGRIELTASAMLSLGRRLPVYIDTNLAPTSQTITYTVCDEVASTSPGAGSNGQSSNTNGACGNLGLGPIKAGTIRVPFYASNPSTGSVGWLNPGYQQIDQKRSAANSTYEAAMIKLARYGRSGLSLHAHYTYAHAMDWNPGESPLDAVDLRQEDGNNKIGEYGTSNLDVRHSAAVMVIYESPWKLRGFAGRIANGWMLSSIGQFRSGLPYTMRVTGSLPEEIPNSPGSSGYPITGLRPGMNGSGGDNRVYGLGNDGQFYNIGRNTFRYPNTWKADLRVGKKFNLGEMRELELLAESFNLFNHQNVTEIETTGYVIDSGSSGSSPTLNFLTGLKISSTTGLPVSAFGQPLNINATDFYRERQTQFGLRMLF